jgi:ATP-dependent RNA helicase DDX56/DBP9
MGNSIAHADRRTLQILWSCANPQALEGKDIVARARTGSGKTLAYLLPALQAVLTGGKGRAGWQALILVPSRELCEQVSMLPPAAELAVDTQLGSVTLSQIITAGAAVMRALGVMLMTAAS